MQPVEPLTILPGWKIPVGDLSLRFVRSSGPGGQNVNKVATKVELRFLLAKTQALSDSQKARLRQRFPATVNQLGELVITCDESRSQAMNIQTARIRLIKMILEVRNPPTVRRPTHPSRGAKQRRLTAKKQRAEVKRGRSPIDY